MALPDAKYTKAQQAFIQQRAQQLLVEWCDKLMNSGDHTRTIRLNRDNPYVNYALTRKSPWLSDKGEGQFRVLATGWSAAASFLKR